jgi:hypothetical protein
MVAVRIRSVVILGAQRPKRFLANNQKGKSPDLPIANPCFVVVLFVHMHKAVAVVVVRNMNNLVMGARVFKCFYF